LIVSVIGFDVDPPWVANAPTMTAPFITTVPEVLDRPRELGMPAHGVGPSVELPFSVPVHRDPYGPA
jgi:hypothetical protein